MPGGVRRAGLLGAFAVGRGSRRPDLEDLTPREREVRYHLACGYAYKQIRARLGISARTVESNVGAALRKLQLRSRDEVTHWAAARGLIGDSADRELGVPAPRTIEVERDPSIAGTVSYGTVATRDRQISPRNA